MVATLGQQYNVGEKPTVILYVCMLYGHHNIQQGMDQPGNKVVANPARGQVNRENEHSPVPVRA